jgi:hypothetical protein
MDAMTFLKEAGRDAAEQVARAAGTNYVYFSQIAYGHRKPSPNLARRLVEASGAKLTLAGLRPDLWGEGGAK